MNKKVVDYSQHVISFESQLRRAYPARPVESFPTLTPLQQQLLSIYAADSVLRTPSRQPIKFEPRYMRVA